MAASTPASPLSRRPRPGLAVAVLDKIGYFFDSRTGEPTHNVIESDNYRGLFASAGGLFVQTDITVSAVTGAGQVVWHRRFPMESIVDGCFFPGS